MSTRLSSFTIPIFYPDYHVPPQHPATVSFNVSGSGVNASVVLRLVIGLRVAINGSGGVKSYDLPASAAVSGGSKGGLTLTFDPDMVLGLTFRRV